MKSNSNLFSALFGAIVVAIVMAIVNVTECNILGGAVAFTFVAVFVAANYKLLKNKARVVLFVVCIFAALSAGVWHSIACHNTAKNANFAEVELIEDKKEDATDAANEDAEDADVNDAANEDAEEDANDVANVPTNQNNGINKSNAGKLQPTYTANADVKKGETKVEGKKEKDFVADNETSQFVKDMEEEIVEAKKDETKEVEEIGEGIVVITTTEKADETTKKEENNVEEKKVDLSKENIVEVPNTNTDTTVTTYTVESTDNAEVFVDSIEEANDADLDAMLGESENFNNTISEKNDDTEMVEKNDVINNTTETLNVNDDATSDAENNEAVTDVVEKVEVNEEVETFVEEVKAENPVGVRALDGYKGYVGSDIQFEISGDNAVVDTDCAHSFSGNSLTLHLGEEVTVYTVDVYNGSSDISFDVTVDAIN